MGIVGYAIAYFGLTLQCLLFWRCFKTRLWRHYPYFFIYVVYTLLDSAVLFAFYVLKAPSYALIYWVAYLIGSVVRFAVAWEVFRMIFPRGSPVRRIAGGVLVAVLLSLAVTFFLSGSRPADYIVADVLRKMSLTIAAWLLIVFGLARLYARPITRNIWGMAVGLFIFVSSQIVSFAAVDISSIFRPLWSLVVPFGFVLMILIWTFTLWSYVPDARPDVPDGSSQLEALYYWEYRRANLDAVVRKVLKP